ncbi:uncharacterized protein [Elaeis guineensis]|uniref:uncharacterized protein n=1 Tax=Elaeis guineensis var. tenera TaxID=51953 RepID=UPI003C6D3460
MAKAEARWIDCRSHLHALVANILDDRQIDKDCEELKSEPVSKEDWLWLLNYWRADETFKKRSVAEKANRKKLKILYTLGQLAFEAVAHDLEKKKGMRPDDLELWETTHTNKSGEWVNYKSREAYIAAVIQIEVIEKNSLDPETGEVIPLPPEVRSQALHQILGKVPRSHGQTSVQDNPSIVALREELAEEWHRHNQTREELSQTREELSDLKTQLVDHHETRKELLELKAYLAALTDHVG